MLVNDKFKDYELIDTSCGEKLERWGEIYLLRPDPLIIWDRGNLRDKYKIDAHYHRKNTGGGYWENISSVPSRWTITYRDLVFNIKQMGFKHTGLFPEQASNWDFMIDKISNSKRNIRVLNLFAYTGGATLACMKAGAHVTHVDSSRGMVDWCKENVSSSKLDPTKVRYIVDDVIKFVQREIRRGNKYDAIIMDPPSYGRGANGEVWSLENNLSYLVKICSEILSEEPLFFLINSYTTGISSTSLYNMLSIIMDKYNGNISHGEVGIKSKDGFILPCGIYCRWES